MNRFRRTVASVAPLVLLLLTIESVPAMGFDETFEASYTTIGEFQLDAEFFDVEVETGPGNKATIAARGIPRGISLSERVREGAVRIDVRGRNPWFASRPERSRITVRLPAGTSVRLASCSGDIRISDIRGGLEVRAGSGDVQLDGVGGTVRIDAQSGDVSVRDSVGDLQIRTSSGDIRVREVRGILNLMSASGDIDGDRVELTAPATFRSTSGEIDVDFANRIDDLGYRLTTASGELVFGERRGERTLEGGRGRFLVIGETQSGDQRYE